VKMRIGVDFDNTIVGYGEVFHSVAIEWGLIRGDSEQDKKAIRDQIRHLPDGDIEWQKVQAEVYGPRMNEARLIEGVREFFARCQQQNIKINIISHKTKYAHFDRMGIDLREAALAWMDCQGFFAADGWGLLPSDVFFETTRLEKIDRIGLLGCTHFIDDLEEVFLEDSFPCGVDKILFNPDACQPTLHTVRFASSWKEIRGFIFGAAAG
jgi:hypothetical protein